MPQPNPYARPLAAVDSQLTTETNRRRVITAARDRRDRDMLDAMRDVERYEQQLTDIDRRVELLFEERQIAQRNETSAGNETTSRTEAPRLHGNPPAPGRPG